LPSREGAVEDDQQLASVARLRVRQVVGRRALRRQDLERQIALLTGEDLLRHTPIEELEILGRKTTHRLAIDKHP
jgi:hypothetical protein